MTAARTKAVVAQDRARIARRRTLFNGLTVLLLLGLVGLAITAVLADQPKLLPAQFRILQSRLSNLPITVKSVISCSCWSGPRQQAERKYKFELINDGPTAVRIGGGESSQIRLIVAYPTPNLPVALTFPVPQSSDEYMRFGTPSDIDLRVATRYEDVRPSQIIRSNAVLNVPSSYSVWALPPVPNKLAETLGNPSAGTFPTIVDKQQLLPGEGYSSDRLGHGTWSFYVPIDAELSAAVDQLGDLELASDDSSIEGHLIFVGIGLFEPHGRSAADLLGFAPAPSDAALLDPSAF